MKKILFLLNAFFIFTIIMTFKLDAKSSFFDEGKLLFEKEKFDDSKIFFERDIVFNPKSENSYLFLAKIFNNKEDDINEEMNLNNVLLLNPKNEEALYMLTILKIKQSNYYEVEELIERFVLVCKNFCSKTNEVKKKFSKLIPENEQKKN